MRSREKEGCVMLTNKLKALLFTGILTILIPAVSFATPPDRPISITPQILEDNQIIKSDEKYFYLPVRVSTLNVKRGDVILNVIVYSPDQRKQRIMESISTSLEERDEQKEGTVVQIPRLQKDGIYRIEIAAGDRKGAIYDRVALYQVVEKKEARIYTQRQWRDHRKNLRFNKYEKAKTVRVFSGNLKKLTEEELEETKVTVIRDPRKVLRVKADNNLGLDAKFVLDSSAKAWRDRDPVTYRGRIVFTDFEGTVRPLVNGGIYLYDDDTFGDEFLGSVTTNGNGEFSFSVNNDDGFLQNGRDLYIKLKLRNTRWRVHDGGDYEWATSVSDDLNEGQVVDIGTVTPDDDMEAVQIFSFMDRAWQHVVTVGGRDPGFVNVDYPGGGDFFDGEVNLSASTNRAPDIAIHEYGHFLLESAYPGGDPSPGGAHNFGEMNQDPRLSWSEGWATAFMLSLCNDGQYNWDEGTTEGAGEWPTCTNQNDSGGQELELYSGTNRTGETQEARVAATLLDLMDSDNDDNGGNQNRGRDDLEDDNTANRVSLHTIYSDVLWGGGHNNALEFWTSLSGEISGNTWNDANEIFRYNWMSISAPIEINCVASKVASRAFRDYDEKIKNLRAFRNEGLKPYAIGRQLMQSYYRHSPEMAILLIKDPKARKHAALLISHFSQLGKASHDRKLFEKMAGRDARFIPERIGKSVKAIFSLIQEQGSKELKRDMIKAQRLFQKVEKMKYSEVIDFTNTLKKADGISIKPVIQGKYAPASKKADWKLIRENLPKVMGRREKGMIIKRQPRN